MKKFFSFFAAVLFAGSMMAEAETIFTYNGKGVTTAEEIVKAGGSLTVYGGNTNIVADQKQKGNMCIKINKGFTKSGVYYYMAITLDQPLQAGDKITTAAFRTGNQDCIYGMDFNAVADSASATDACQVLFDNNLQILSSDGVPADTTFTVPAEADGARFIRLYRKSGSTGLWIANFTITREGGVTPPQPAIASPYCQTEVGHFFAANADPNSFVLLSIGSKGGKTIVRIDQDAAKNTQMFDYLQVTGLATDGKDVAEGGATAMAVEFDTPTAVNDSITLEILWSTVNWPGRWMVQNVKVPATAECEYAVLVPAPVVKKTCAEVYTLAKNDAVALNDVVVTYVNGQNVWVKDATASMLVFLPADATWNAGDVLSEVAGVVDIYYDVYEVKPSAEQVTAIVATPGEAPAAEVVTEVALTDVNKYIVMQNVEFAEEAAFAEGTRSNITINGVTVRNQFKNGYSFTTGKKYNVYGVVTIFNSNPQVYFITAEEASATAINNTADEIKAFKTIENGQLVIIKNGVRYDATGAVIR